ncbi:porin family protein [Treponema primitia]|uniref:outer membrane beta-barrel protein n=1 Tax=Treponema primitia TaxID=88058 RepID=UPI003980CB56
MKNLFFALVFCLGITGISLFAFEPEDLTKYPSAVPANSFAANIGIGFNSPEYGDLTVPPLSASLDYNLPIRGLPFFVGGIVGFYGSFAESGAGATKIESSYTVFDIGARFGYHFNWGVDGLDTYAIATLGLALESAQVKWGSYYNSGDTTDSDTSLLFGVAIGARWFFTPVIGVFLELGYSALSFASTGLSIHF